MGVDDHTDGDLIPAAKDDVGGLAGDSGKLEQLFHGLRHLVAELLDHGLRRALDGLGLVAEEAGGADERFKLGQGSGGHVLWRGIGAEERGRDQVDAGVGALGGEDGGDRELPGAGVVQRADDAGVGLGERVQDGGNALGGERLFRLAGALLGGGGFVGGDRAGLGTGRSWRRPTHDCAYLGCLRFHG